MSILQIRAAVKILIDLYRTFVKNLPLAFRPCSCGYPFRHRHGCANFQMDAASPMALILVGQTELRHRLRLQTLEPVTQRVNLRFHLTGLSAREIRAYIQHHLQVSGVKHVLFSDEAINALASLFKKR